MQCRSTLNKRRTVSTLAKRAPHKGSRVAGPSVPYARRRCRDCPQGEAHARGDLQDALEIRQSGIKKLDRRAGGNWLTDRGEADRETSCVRTSRGAALAWDFLGQLGGKNGHTALLLDIIRNRNALFW